MAGIVSLTADLMFSSNIEATLGRAGHSVVTVEDLTALETALQAADVGLIVLDLHAGIEAADVIAVAANATHGGRPIPVLAFGRHTEPALLRRAREAGCAEVVPRSTFVEEMAALAERAIAAGS
jgi:CheY-like chemotaxis protein